MQIEFRKTFRQDLQNLKDRKIKERLQQVIQEVEAATTLVEIHNIKALQGYQGYYRIRLGDYRVGLFVEKGVVAFVRVLNRKEVYRYFP